jgi:hypothetical protein
MMIILNKVLCITGKVFSLAVDIAAMFSLASSKLSATSLSPNPALAEHFFSLFLL